MLSSPTSTRSLRYASISLPPLPVVAVLRSLYVCPCLRLGCVKLSEYATLQPDAFHVYRCLIAILSGRRLFRWAFSMEQIFVIARWGAYGDRRWNGGQLSCTCTCWLCDLSHLERAHYSVAWFARLFSIATERSGDRRPPIANIRQHFCWSWYDRY